MASQMLSTSSAASADAGAAAASYAKANGSKSSGGYKQPPQEILQIVDAPPQPSLSFSPDRRLILQMQRPPSLPPIAEISRPELKLAGVRIDAAQFSRSRMGYNVSLAVVSADEVVPSAAAKEITGYPPGSCINYVSWSPDGRRVAFTTRSPGGPGDPPRGPLQLWVADVESGTARPLLGARRLNTVFDSYSWVDDTTLVACCVPEGIGAPPERPPAPLGPKIQDNMAARKSQNRTYADLLKDGVDSDLFEYYGTSELVAADVATGEARLLAPPRLYTEVDASPDGEWLMVSWLERPFSFAVPCGRFPARVELWRKDGSFCREVAYLPLAEELPNKFDATRPGPRGISWRGDSPAELAWIEAQDGGDPDVDVSPRDIIYTLDATEAEGGTAPRELARTDMRCGGVAWCDGDLCLVYESKWATRRSRIWTASPDRRGEAPQLLFDRSYEDVYNDPGSPLSRRTARGTYVLAKIDGKRQFLMAGSGASPGGNRPFLDLLDIDTKESQRLWQSTPPYLEATGSIMSDANGDAPITLDGLKLLRSRETAQDPPQTWIMTLSKAPGGDISITERQLTDYPHPHPQLRDLQKEVLRYKRDDGVDLTGTLYLPPGHNPERDGPLPTILWAYPREFKSKEAAGQMRRSPHQFSSIGSQSPLLWLARGYAVLDGPTFPIVAEGDQEPNDSYVEQLTAAGRAAVEELVRRGITDPARVSVGGHSYGAFMTANLLAHLPDVFAAGIARSGAYNRTLTPMGFQSEQRTLWDCPEVYSRMSPFMMADLIKKPLLLVHGDADNNPGTHTMQSERMYSALKGHGCPTRLVLLPHESHSYVARESVLHCLYEQDQWLERYAGYGRTDPEYGEAGDAGVSADGSTTE